MSKRQDVEGVGILIKYNSVIARPQSNGARTSHRHYVADAAQCVCVQSVSDLPLMLGAQLVKGLGGVWAKHDGFHALQYRLH